MYLYKVNSKEHGFCCCMFSTKIFRCCPLHFVLTVCAVLQPGSWLGQQSLPGGQLGERGHEHSSHLLGHQVQPAWRQHQASTYSRALQPLPGTPSPANLTSAPGKYLPTHEHHSHLLGHQVQPTWRQHQASTYSRAPQPPPRTPSPANLTSVPGKYLLNSTTATSWDTKSSQPDVSTRQVPTHRFGHFFLSVAIPSYQFVRCRYCTTTRY